MLCGILVVVALLGLLGTAPSASAKVCAIEFLNHAHAVLKSMSVLSNGRDCRKNFQTMSDLRELCNADRLNNWCLMAELNALRLPDSKSEAVSVENDKVQYMLNNDIKYNANENKLYILGEAVDLKLFKTFRPKPFEEETPKLEETPGIDGPSLKAYFASHFYVGESHFIVAATATFDFVDADLDDPEELLLRKPNQHTVHVEDDSNKVVGLLNVAWAKIAKFFSGANSEVDYDELTLFFWSYSAVAVADQEEFEELLDHIKTWVDGSPADDFSPPAMQGKAHHNHRQANRHKRRVGRGRRGRGRHGHRGRHGR